MKDNKHPLIYAMISQVCISLALDFTGFYFSQKHQLLDRPLTL